MTRGSISDEGSRQRVTFVSINSDFSHIILAGAFQLSVNTAHYHLLCPCHASMLPTHGDRPYRATVMVQDSINCQSHSL